MKRKGEQLSAMLGLIADVFANKVDKGGWPYVLHLIRVMVGLRTNDEEMQCIALGHDLFEDTDVTELRLRAMGFSERVIAGIRHLTRLPGESEHEYRTKVKANADSREVKKSDLGDNMDLSRLPSVTERDLARNARYDEFLKELQALPSVA